MALNVPTFFKRLGSSVVFVAIMLTGLLWNEWSFLVLVCIIGFLCAREYFRLMQNIDKESYWPRWMPIAVQAAGLIAILLVFFTVNYDKEFATLLLNAGSLLSVFIFIFIPTFILLAVLPERTAWQACMQSLFGILYIVVPMGLLILLRNYHHLLPLYLIVLIWTNDTMAYLTGSFFGKTPFSSISPKKTWEGVIGGAIFTIALAVVMGYYFSDGKYALPVYHNAACVACYGIIVSIAGPAGDLLKSKFKRIAGVKDSGNLMPGHGGALDRFDSLIISTPFVYVCTYLFYLIH